jgi:D-alanyl-D-alanine carboxypeptidase
LNKKTLLTVSLSVIAITVFSGVVFTKISKAGDNDLAAANTQVSSSSTDAESSDGDFTYIPPTLEDGTDTKDETTNEADFEEETEAFVPNTEMDLDPSSITVFVNKEYAIPKDYKPKELVTPDVVFNLITYDERTLMRPEAAKALEELFEAAKKDGIILYGISAYRSYQRQYTIFTNNIVKQGKEHTLKYSAVPGTSEHQTGLAIDVSSKSLGFKLSSNFSSSPEGIWLAENAYRYGYIIRYPEDKADITGYAYEPWHIRYVGIGLANYLYTNDLTLDEYYDYTPSPDFDFEALYADMINYVPPVVTVIPPEGDGVIVGENGEIIEGELGEGEVPTEGAEEDTTDQEPVEETEDPEDPATEDPDEEDAPTEDGEDTEDPQPSDIPDEQGQTDGEEGDTEDEDSTDPTTETPIDDPSTEEDESLAETTDTLTNSSTSNAENSDEITISDINMN